MPSKTLRVVDPRDSINPHNTDPADATRPVSRAVVAIWGNHAYRARSILTEQGSPCHPEAHKANIYVHTWDGGEYAVAHDGTRTDVKPPKASEAYVGAVCSYCGKEVDDLCARCMCPRSDHDGGGPCSTILSTDADGNREEYCPCGSFVERANGTGENA